MENEFKQYTPEFEAELDKLGISYVWRDSCVDILAEFRKCKKNDYKILFPLLNKLSNCRGIQQLYIDCQVERETELMNKYFTTYQKMESEIIAKSNKLK